MQVHCATLQCTSLPHIYKVIIPGGYMRREGTGKFQNLDPKSVTFFHVSRHFLALNRYFKYRNRNLDKIAVILVVSRGLYVQY